MRMSLREGMNANILKCTYDVVVVVAMVPACLAQRFSHLKDNSAPCPADGRGRSLNLLSLVKVLGEI